MPKFSDSYRLQNRIGIGGFSHVWRAQRADGNWVAVKIHDAKDRIGVLQHADEARVISTLDHPNIVKVLDYGETDVPVDRAPAGSPYLVMELADGGTLADVGWPNNWAEAVQLADQLLDAVAHAHARRVVHRDIKPANILWARHDSRSLRLADFGIAHATDRVARTGLAGRTAGTSEKAVGTPRYAALEQQLGKWREYGPWTDLYSVGVLVADLVSEPCSAEDPNRLPLPRNAPSLRPRYAVPPGLVEWITRATGTRPQSRFQSARAAQVALKSLGDAPSEHTTPADLGDALSATDDDVTAAVELFSLPLPRGVRMKSQPPVGLGPTTRFRDPHSVLRRIQQLSESPGIICLTGATGSGRRRTSMEFGIRLREIDPRRTLEIECGGDWQPSACAAALALRLRTSGLEGKRLAKRIGRALPDALQRERLQTLITNPRSASIDEAGEAIRGLASAGLRSVILYDPGQSAEVESFAELLSSDLAVLSVGSRVGHNPVCLETKSLGAEARRAWAREFGWPEQWGEMGLHLTHGTWLGRARLAAWKSVDCADDHAFEMAQGEVRSWLQARLPRAELSALEWAARRSPSIPTATLDRRAPRSAQELRATLEPAIRRGILRRVGNGWRFEHRELAELLCPGHRSGT